MSWVQHFDDDDWEAYPGQSPCIIWTGTTWQNDSNLCYPPWTAVVHIKDIGDWVDDYRPAYVRATYTMDSAFSVRLWLRDSDMNTIADSGLGSYISGDSVACSFASASDIDNIYIGSYSAAGEPGIFTCTIIEFGEPTICSEALDGILLQAEALEHYIKTMAPSLYGFNTKNVQQMIDLDAKIPALQDSDLARRNADYFRKLSDQWVHWTRYDKEARRSLI